MVTERGNLKEEIKEYGNHQLSIYIHIITFTYGEWLWLVIYDQR